MGDRLTQFNHLRVTAAKIVAITEGSNAMRLKRGIELGNPLAVVMAIAQKHIGRRGGGLLRIFHLWILTALYPLGSQSQ